MLVALKTCNCAGHCIIAYSKAVIVNGLHFLVHALQQYVQFMYRVYCGYRYIVVTSATQAARQIWMPFTMSFDSHSALP